MSSNNKRCYYRWTDKEKEYLKEISKKYTTSESIELMNEKFSYNFTRGQIKRAKIKYGIKSNINIVVGVKGNKPFNKGLKQSEYMSQRAIEKCKSARFKKGHIPWHTKKVGTERRDKDGYTVIKTKEGNWEFKHRYIWEQEFGKIPSGYLLLFADGNKENITLENLIMISRKELLTMNAKKLIFNDAELTKTGLLMANLYIKMSDGKRKLNKIK